MLVLFLRDLPGRLSYVDAFTTGRVVGGSPLAIPFLIFWTLWDLVLITLAWGVYRRSAPARIRLLVLLAINWLPTIAQVGLFVAGGHAERVASLFPNSWFLSALLKDAGLVALLLSPWGASAVQPPTPADWAAHAKRAGLARAIGSSWQRLGRWDNTVLIPVIFGSFLVAPFTWSGAGLFYLTVVLPLKPRLRGRRVNAV